MSWVGYLGSPIAPRELLHDPRRSLIEQSRRHAPNMEIPNGDGTGLGWYEHRSEPALFRSITPAWGDENLLELATEIRTRLFLAHVRAGTGTPSSRPTVTRSATAIGFLCTTDMSRDMRGCAGNCCWPCTPSCSAT